MPFKNIMLAPNIELEYKNRDGVECTCIDFKNKHYTIRIHESSVHIFPIGHELDGVFINGWGDIEVYNPERFKETVQSRTKRSKI